MQTEYALQTNVDIVTFDAIAQWCPYAGLYAGGNSRLNIHPGLVRGRYCAIDNRFVQPATQSVIAWFDTDNHDVRVHAKESGTYEVHVLDVVGRVVQTQHVTLEANTTQIFSLHSWIRPESQWHLLRVTRD